MLDELLQRLLGKWNSRKLAMLGVVLGAVVWGVPIPAETTGWISVVVPIIQSIVVAITGREYMQGQSIVDAAEKANGAK